MNDGCLAVSLEPSTDLKVFRVVQWLLTVLWVGEPGKGIEINV